MTLYEKYIDDVSNKRIVVPKTIQQAVKRHLSDLRKAKTKKYPFYFDTAKADKYMKFISMFRLTDQAMEKSTGQLPLIPVQPFQAFFIASVFGWRHKNKPDVRRFNDVYFQVARKNAKSTLVACMIVAQFYLDGMNMAQFYTAATSREQAGEVFEMAKAIISELCKEYPSIAERTEILTHRIVDLKNKSFITKVSKEAKTLEGKGSYVSSLDEYHVHKKDDIVSSLKKGGVKYDSPIMYRLTTPGFSIGGPCHEHYMYCKKILEGKITNDSVFVQIYELDPDDDFHDKSLWKKANPNLGLSPKLASLEDEYNIAVAKGGFYIVDFKTKMLSMWVSSSSEWISDYKYIRSCSDWSINDHMGASVTMSLDMAYSDRGDITALCVCFEHEGKIKFHHEYFIPEAKAKDTATTKTVEIDYIAMSEQGFMYLTEGDTTDYDVIMKRLEWFNDNFDIRRLYFDAWNISYFYEQMVKRGLPVFKFNQNPGHMSPPTKRIGEMIHKKECDFGMNKVTRWMFSNVELKDKGNGLVMMSRSNVQRKIDGPVSAAMAYAAWIDEKLEYEEFNPQIIIL